MGPSAVGLDSSECVDTVSERLVLLFSIKKFSGPFHRGLTSPGDPKMVAQPKLCTLADLGERTETGKAVREHVRRASWQALVF